MGILDSLANVFQGQNGTSPASGVSGVENYGKMQGVLGTLDALVKAAETGQGQSSQGRMSPLGLDAIIQDWVRQQFIYRRSILQDLFVLAFQVTEIRSVILSIQREVFRKGFGNWEQKWARKCPQCGEESEDDEQEECDSCYIYEIVEQEIIDPENDTLSTRRFKRYKRGEDGERVRHEMMVPDITQQFAFEPLLRDANSFHQPLTSVLTEFLADVLIADDGFLLLNKEYEVDRETGEVSSQRIFEITRLHPALTEYDIDRKDGLPERSHWMCPLHREQQTHTAPGNCVALNDEGYSCNAILIPAMYRYYWRGRYRYYTKDEILHASFFSPSKTYGYSPVLTVFEKVLALVGADRTLYRYWYERRIPPGLIITYTDDPDSLETEIERIKTQMLNDPNTFPWVAASARNNRGKTDFVKLAYTFQELDYMPVRQEIRERIAMLWGVTPLFTGDASSAGGSLAKETAQTSMHDNLIESYQNIINDQIMPHLLEQLGVTDFEIKLSPPVEKTEDDSISIEKARLEVAMQMQQLGYEPVKEKGKEIRFTYKKAAMPPGMGMPGMDGGMPGMPGMEGGLPGMPPPMGGVPEEAPAGGGVGLAPPPPPPESPQITEGGLLDDMEEETEEEE
ncbi:hypothetical protein CMI37_07920 [Candidatus Pacearchaeota archaeon]|nr:hypothetical protein [Candidatus Pacearchaeota archaeon]|tara:strand:- start:328 stop:2199 length:1872 start_codon:yes stop_codon:yes gene_type:complete